MDLGVKDQVAVVCGASRGMGRAIALQFAEEGAQVFIIARNADDVDRVVDEIKKEGGNAEGFPFDLSQVDQIPELIKKIKAKAKNIHILINNAGGPPPGGLYDVSAEDWQKAIDQNLKSVIAMTKEILPGMQKQKYGRIINITSQYVKEPPATMVLSNTTRAGVVAFAKSIVTECAKDNVTVNTLCPGPVFTGRMQSLIEQRATKEGKTNQEIEELVRNTVPMGRIADPEEFASVAVFLCSKRASYVTGTTISVDGGVTKGLL